MGQVIGMLTRIMMTSAIYNKASDMMYTNSTHFYIYDSVFYTGFIKGINFEAVSI